MIGRHSRAEETPLFTDDRSPVLCIGPVTLFPSRGTVLELWGNLGLIWRSPKLGPWSLFTPPPTPAPAQI